MESAYVKLHINQRYHWELRIFAAHFTVSLRVLLQSTLISDMKTRSVATEHTYQARHALLRCNLHLGFKL